MQRSSFFLRTKLLPPRAVPDILERPRLIERLRSNIGSPITMVAADAGCGKTTLVAEFIRHQTRPYVWYQLDHTDADPSVFLGYVANGIRNVFPEFGDTLLPYLSEASEELARIPERAADLLINEILNAVEQPFILVLDDYHHIGRETVVHKIVDRILQYSSDLLHLLITTRDLPPLAIMRRRTQFAGMLITREDLLFNDDEVKELFKTTLGVDLGEEALEAYRSRTQGWVTALQLVRQVADQEMLSRTGNTPPDLAEILDRSEKDIFDYFAEEVLSQEPLETQRLMLSFSLLESLPLDLCSRLFPEQRCSAVLPELAQKNVFLTVAGDGRSAEEYRFHPLFRNFLLRRLRTEIGQGGVADERNRIARFFLDDGQWEKALPFLIDAENFDEAAAVIAEKGGEWIAAGAFISLGSFAGRVPGRHLDSHPHALLHLAEVARLQGETDRATELLSRAVRLFGKTGDNAGEAEALHSLASLARRTGKIAEAIKLLEDAGSLADPRSATAMKCANTRGLCLIAERKHTEAEQQFRVALELAEQLGDSRFARLVTHNLALSPGYRGDFAEALRWFKRIFRDGGADNQLPQESIGHLNMARLHLYRGEFKETESHLNRSLELCQLYNLRSLRGEIFEAFGNFYRETGDLARAFEFYDRAQAAYDDADIDANNRELNEERAKLQLLRGDVPSARSLLERLIAARTAAGSPTATAELCLCRADLAGGRTEKLDERVSALLDVFHQQGNYYDEALASMQLAEVYSRSASRKKMFAMVQRVLDLSARFDYEHWLKTEIRRNPAIFLDEDIIERLPLDLRTELRGAPKTAAVQLAETPEPAVSLADLTVKVLGPVEIVRDAAKPFAPDAWTTRRARDIFCFIATSKYRRTAKDVLIDTFWRDEDPAVIEKNFHPTISHIRKALNSRQAYKQNFILFRDGAYQLNPELAYLIDTEDFELAVAEAEKAKREKDADGLRAALERAHSLYRGEFMQGVYDEWADERRGYYAEQFLRVVAALAKLHFSERKVAAAQKFAQELIALDPYREDMHRLVMRILASQGKPAAVKKHFENLTALLNSELGIEPSPETRRVFSELMS